ncbi:hypothetical protein TBLA_0B08970 [Henningerozyma blattae CBS 6284]|uniref:Mitochondrial carrier protein n=1 Tax=Henningerozyma blattae (strain ATCC 34711 / CBS 6284 / DSM 70876 / NBRC 10599 / NRRL Y-10934 / UCD 77-7) TaxID=1071380 RepID=I2H010_HENB6|nr:hypothetical protein TBLA_0B08970 [Tetrapisispora blattae CBS 6284]CCH59712.1 hypothetical protein TBLA_0B08970 [Tetrapisispora blattae CBS 6284]
MKNNGNEKIEISNVGSFMAGGLAACIAVTLTNPIEVVKTKMQLASKHTHSGAKVLQSAVNNSVQVISRNPIKVMSDTWKAGGMRAVQRGLIAAYLYQLSMNGIRLGLYGPVAQEVPAMVAGAIVGSAGAFFGAPLQLAKTRLQAQALHSGTKSTHKGGAWVVLKNVYAARGITGLWRGVNVGMVRCTAGSCVQQPAYFAVKGWFSNKYGWKDSIPLHFLSSAIAGLAVGFAINPWDVVLTHMVAHPGSSKGGMIACMANIITHEGPMALFKGIEAQLLRIAPHTVLCLVFLEQTKRYIGTFENKIHKSSKFEAAEPLAIITPSNIKVNSTDIA